MFSIGWLLLGIGNASGSLFGPLFSSLFDHDDLDQAFGMLNFVNIGANAFGSLFGLIPPILVSNMGLTLSRSYWFMLVVGVMFFTSQMPIFVNVLRTADLPGPSNDKKSTLRSRGVVAKFALMYTIQNLAFGAFFGLFPSSPLARSSACSLFTLTQSMVSNLIPLVSCSQGSKLSGLG
jgi:hypothetical protein